MRHKLCSLNFHEHVWQKEHWQQYLWKSLLQIQWSYSRLASCHVSSRGWLYTHESENMMQLLKPVACKRFIFATKTHVYTSSPSKLPWWTIQGGSVVKMSAASPRFLFAFASKARRYSLLLPQKPYSFSICSRSSYEAHSCSLYVDQHDVRNFHTETKVSV